MLRMFYGRLLAAALLAVPVMAVADSVLYLPDHIELRSINGEDVRSSLLARKNSFRLPAGEVVLELRYSDVLPASVGDSHSNFRSEPVATRFVSVDGEHYQVQAVQPATEAQAAAFARDPRLQLVLKNSGAAVGQTFFDVKQWRLARQAPVLATPAAGAATPVGAAVPSSQVTGPVSAPASSTAEADSLAAQNLWFWWQQADEASRQAFLRRIGR